MRSIPVNGLVCAFRRDDGKLHWHAEVHNQQLVLEQFQDLPIVLFTARYNKLIGAGRGAMQVAAVKSIDKSSGKLVCYEELPNGQQFHTLQVDAAKGTIDFVSYQTKIRHYAVEEKKP